jgi:hypothetical protein
MMVYNFLPLNRPQETWFKCMTKEICSIYAWQLFTSIEKKKTILTEHLHLMVFAASVFSKVYLL